MKIYKDPIVEECQAWYGELLETTKFFKIKEHLDLLTNRLYEGYVNNISGCFYEFSNYHPDLLGWNHQNIKKRGIKMDDCQITIASECGYDSWENISGIYNLNFEHALHYLLNGNQDEFLLILQEHPHLVYEKSSYSHNATLLHYATSNGVEMWRQQVPLNLVSMVDILLQSGADAKQKMNVYGGHYDVISLLISSAHPYEAGIGEELEIIISKYLNNS